MKGNRSIFLIFWSSLAIIILSMLIGGLIFGSSAKVRQNGMPASTPVATEDDNMTVYLDETISMDGIDMIQLNPAAGEMTVRHSEDGNFRIVQRGSNLDERFLVTVSNSGSEIRVQPAARSGISGWFGVSWPKENYIDVYIPSGYSRELGIKLSAGDLRIRDAFELSGMDIHVSAGKLVSDAALSAAKAELNVSAGGLDMASLQSGNYKLRTSAGKLKIADLKGSGEISSSAGAIELPRVEIADKLSIHSSAGSIKLGLAGDPSLDFTARSSAGSVKTYFGAEASGAGGKVSRQVGDPPYKILEVSSSAGSIRIEKAE